MAPEVDAEDGDELAGEAEPVLYDPNAFKALIDSKACVSLNIAVEHLTACLGALSAALEQQQKQMQTMETRHNEYKEAKDAETAALAEKYTALADTVTKAASDAEERHNTMSERLQDCEGTAKDASGKPTMNPKEFDNLKTEVGMHSETLKELNEVTEKSTEEVTALKEALEAANAKAAALESEVDKLVGRVVADLFKKLWHGLAVCS